MSCCHDSPRDGRWSVQVPCVSQLQSQSPLLPVRHTSAWWCCVLLAPSALHCWLTSSAFCFCVGAGVLAGTFKELENWCSVINKIPGGRPTSVFIVCSIFWCITSGSWGCCSFAKRSVVCVHITLNVQSFRGLDCVYVIAFACFFAG